MNDITTIGIIGTGKLGITLARIARHYGFEVLISGSAEPGKIALTAEVLAPGSTAMSTEDVAKHADVIILALPLGKFTTLPSDALANKLVVDAMNFWWEVDGERDDIIPSEKPSSVGVQEFLSKSRVVKAFNHIGYHDLFDEHKPVGDPGRKAMAFAGDNASDIKIVHNLINALGFDALNIGRLSESARLEPGTNVFGANIKKIELERLLNK